MEMLKLIEKHKLLTVSNIFYKKNIRCFTNVQKYKTVKFIMIPPSIFDEIEKSRNISDLYVDAVMDHGNYQLKIFGCISRSGSGGLTTYELYDSIEDNIKDQYIRNIDKPTWVLINDYMIGMLFSISDDRIRVEMEVSNV